MPNNRRKMCHNLPFGGRATRGSRVRLPRKENVRSCHQSLFEENVRKKQKKRVYEFQRKRVRELSTHGEGISTPRFHHKGRQPLIECEKSWLQYLFIFPFLCFYFFGGRQERCPCHNNSHLHVEGLLHKKFIIAWFIKETCQPCLVPNTTDATHKINN